MSTNGQQKKSEKNKWVNDPETIHSMSDVAELDGVEHQVAFVLTEGESVIASKDTARAEAHSRDAAVETDLLLSQWSGQKTARKNKGPSLQEEILLRMRAEIEAEINDIRQQDYILGVSLVLIARCFGKDPSQWLPGDKVSNLLIEAVLYSAGMDLPWDFSAIPDYAELKYILGEDRRFQRVFRADKLRPKESAADFSRCPVQDGDIALWTGQSLRLSGFLEKAEGNRHNILSAGCSDSPNGFIYTTLDFFMQTYAPANPIPDVIYRAVKIT